MAGKQLQTTSLSWMPDGKGGMMPTPDLLTTDEAVRYLRLDLVKIKDPKKTLTYYRKEGTLKAAQVGKQLVFPVVELQKLVKKQMEINPR